jgi:hypothetical protein
MLYDSEEDLDDGVATFGSISCDPTPPGIDLGRWRDAAGRHPGLELQQTEAGINPFTRERVQICEAHVVVAGRRVGELIWSSDGTVNVTGITDDVPGVAREVAASLGGRFVADGEAE